MEIFGSGDCVFSSRSLSPVVESFGLLLHLIMCVFDKAGAHAIGSAVRSRRSPIRSFPCRYLWFRGCPPILSGVGHLEGHCSRPPFQPDNGLLDPPSPVACPNGCEAYGVGWSLLLPLQRSSTDRPIGPSRRLHTKSLDQLQDARRRLEDGSRLRHLEDSPKGPQDRPRAISRHPT